MLAHAAVNHFAVARLKNMQWQFSAGEEYDVQGEKRNAIWPHKSHT